MEGTAIYLGYRIFSVKASIPSSPTWHGPGLPSSFLRARLLLKFQQGVFAKMPEHKLERRCGSHPEPRRGKRVLQKLDSIPC
jgi:hypothetical protein